ncbi:MAG TPA: hypothetical protein VGH99_09605 [Pseudonocardia sp.]
MAVTLPTSADVRKLRADTEKAVTSQFDLIRTPLLAWIGAGDLALAKLSELPDQLSADEIRKRVDDVRGRTRRFYSELADRGEDTVERIREQPNVARALRNVEDATDRFERQVERTVDGAHDRGEEILGRVTRETRSAGERAARGAQRTATKAADATGEASEELAGTIEDAGAETARTARSTSRKAANKTAPKSTARK